MNRRLFLSAWLVGLFGPHLLMAADPVDPSSALLEARRLIAERDLPGALQHVEAVLKANPKLGSALYMRGAIHGLAGRHEAAIADYTQIIEQRSINVAAAFDARGSEQFKLGRFAASIADFDKFLELLPEQEPQQWKRGISYYYAGRYDDGRKQFEGYQTFDDNDVENAVWRFLCMARASSVAAAQKDMLKIKTDMRVPMMEVYALYAGTGSVDAVLAAVERGSPNERELNSRRFYAHLYLGLFYEATGDKTRAAEHIRLAAQKHPIDHYMADVARVHHKLLTTDASK